MSASQSQILCVGWSKDGQTNVCGSVHSPSVWERLSEPVRHSIFYAQQYADQLYQKRVTADLLFLGLVTDREGEAAVLLTELGVNVDDVWVEVEKILVKRWWCWPSPHTLAPDGKEAMDLSAKEADALGIGSITTGLVLAGLVAAGNGKAAYLLQARGVDKPKLIQLMESRRQEQEESS